MGSVLKCAVGCFLDICVKSGVICDQTAKNVLMSFLVVAGNELNGPGVGSQSSAGAAPLGGGQEIPETDTTEATEATEAGIMRRNIQALRVWLESEQAAVAQRQANELNRPGVGSQSSAGAAPLGSVQGTSSSSEVAIPEPPAQRQAPPRPKITISNSGSEIHRRHMESPVATSASGHDPSRYLSPRSYRAHLNAELFAKDSPFLLSDAFYEGSRGGTEWRQAAGEIPTTPEDTTALQALCREVDTLWPDENKGGLSFSQFISSVYMGFDQSRYDLMSGEERQLLTNIVIQVKSLGKELGELQKQLADIEAARQTPPQGLKDRIGLLQNGLAKIEAMVRDHGINCHLQLQEIVRRGAQQIDIMVSNSDDVNSPEVVTKQILAQYRLQLVDKVMDFKTGSFFREDHQMRRGESSFPLNFETFSKGRSGGPVFRYLNGRFEERQQAARLVVSDVWGLNEPKVGTNERHAIPDFRLGDFVDPFVRMLTGGEGLRSLATSAEKTFAGLSGETRGALAQTFLESEITFENFCAIYGKGADEMRRDFEKTFKEAAELKGEDFYGVGEKEKKQQRDAIEALKQWMSGTGEKVSLGNISEQFEALDYGAMQTFSDREHITDLLDARGDKPEPAVVAKLFLSHLYHTGALVRPSDVEMEEASTPHQIFPEALVKKTEDRGLSGELAFAIFPSEFVLHPSHADELYFEAQEPSSETCGIHALNHFIGKPIFGSKETEGAHILYKCFTEAPDLISKLRSIRENLVTIQSQLNDDVEKITSEWELKYLKEVKDFVDKQLSELDRAITAVTVMGNEGDRLLENNPLERYADSIHCVSAWFQQFDIIRVGDYDWLIEEGPARLQFKECRRFIERTFEELQKSLSPANGLDPVAIKIALEKIALEKQAEVTLNAESGAGSEITSGPQADASQGKRDLLEALNRDELPNGVDRAIIDMDAHFRCVRRLAGGEWALLDSDQQGGPTTLPAGGLARLLSESSNYQIMYCKSAEDQRRLEAFIANAQ
jgi:hypothetical protein